MSTTTLTLPAGASARAANEGLRGWPARFWKSLLEARQAKADRYVATYLSRLSPEQLRAHGLTAADAERLRWE